MVFQVDDLAVVCADLKTQDLSFIENPFYGQVVHQDFGLSAEH
tara:strand:- start:2135 stop:2263 length:129 start_codon:yes stop_codon:yes gene_type:complete